MKNIKVGMIVNTHGLRGDVKIKLLSDFPELRFAKGAKVYRTCDQGEQELTIQSSRMQKDMLITKFEGFEDINLVEGWKGSVLYIHEDQQQKLEDDEAYFHEIMHSEVYDREEHLLGTVVEIIETGANAVLRVQGVEREYLIPFVKSFVVAFDKEAKIMHVEMMEGL